jgi:hypothetical protein
VISKTLGEDYIGGIIDNSELDTAITDDLTPDKYVLGKYDRNLFRKYTREHQKGTIICFDGIKGGIKNSLVILKKIVALYFRFSLVDDTFNIFIDDEKITYKHLSELADRTEFVWNINNLNDPFIHTELRNLKEKRKLSVPGTLKGFIASVERPRDLIIMNTDERVTVDLFVNGRLREKDILKYIPSARIAVSYFYGQIHFNELDDQERDRFTSNREGVVSDDPKYQAFLTRLKDSVLNKVLEEWDMLRIKYRKTGDVENPRISPKERSSRDLFNVVSDEYTPQIGTKNKGKIDSWVDGLAEDAQFNFSSYAECFISENLIRKYIQENKIQLSPEAKKVVERWKNVETQSKNKGNISIAIRQNASDTSYLSMDDLAYLVDKRDHAKEASLSRDADEYKPMRDALSHTALLTQIAKGKLTSVYENIKGRVNKLLAK